MKTYRVHLFYGGNQLVFKLINGAKYSRIDQKKFF